MLMLNAVCPNGKNYIQKHNQLVGAQTTLKGARKLDIMYSIVSFFLCGFFFWAASRYLTQGEINVSSWEFWENIPLVFLALFFLGAGIYGFSQVGKGQKEETEDAPASRAIAEITVLLVALAIAIWIMFHFGFE